MTLMVAASPLVAFIDPNMIEPDGLTPAATEFLRGLRLAPLALGQSIRAVDEDGQVYEAILERIEGELLFLRVTPIAQGWQVIPFAFSAITRDPQPTGGESNLPVHVEPNPWVLAR